MVSNENVKVYTGGYCPICSVVEEFLRSKGVKYAKINIDEDEEAREEFLKLGFDNLPVTVINRKPILGFDPEAFEKALRKRKK